MVGRLAYVQVTAKVGNLETMKAEKLVAEWAAESVGKLAILVVAN